MLGPAVGLRLAAGALTLLLMTPSIASAALSSVDLDTPGDGLITRDTETGLDWLDLTETAPIEFVGPSVNEVLAGAGGWTNRGFRYATTTEVCMFFDHLGLVPDPCPGSTTHGATMAIMDLIGESACCPGQSIYAEAAFDDGGDPNSHGQGGYVRTIQTGGRVSVFEDSIGVDEPAFLNSHFLVRASPPGPAVPLLDVQAMGLLIALLSLVTYTVASEASKRRRGGTSNLAVHPADPE
jgi:hypothetical protein